MKIYKTWGIAFDTLRPRGVYIVEGSTYEKYNVIIIWKETKIGDIDINFRNQLKYKRSI